MKIKLDEHILPDIIATGCQNSINLKDIDFAVPCGKCIPCQRKRRADWSFRLEQEYLNSNSALFITLTYNDLHLPFYTSKGKLSHLPTLNKKHLQNYIKRLRNEHAKFIKQQSKDLKVKLTAKPLRYYSVGEYGEKHQRPHYHILLFNMDIANLTPIRTKWKKGTIDIGTVTNKSINYVTKYMFKDFDTKNDPRERPFSNMSKGRKKTPYGIIGHSYLDKYSKHHIKSEDLTVRLQNGNCQRLPKAFLKRIFPDKQQRLKISLKSFEQYKNNKIKEYQRILKSHYNNSHIKYMITKDSELNRQRKTINKQETL